MGTLYCALYRGRRYTNFCHQRSGTHLIYERGKCFNFVWRYTHSDTNPDVDTNTNANVDAYSNTNSHRYTYADTYTYANSM